MTSAPPHDRRPGPPGVVAVRLGRRRRRRARLARVAPGLVAGGLGAVGTFWATGAPWPAAVVGLLGVVLTRSGSAVLRRRLVLVTVRGGSMLPAYRDGDRVLVRRGGTPAVGQVVVVERPIHGWHLPPLDAGAPAARIANRIWMIKRVAAVEGDPIPDGLAALLPDGVPWTHVPPGRLVLLGDNRAASMDSRHLGLFPVRRVLGAVLPGRPRPPGTPGPAPARG